MSHRTQGQSQQHPYGVMAGCHFHLLLITQVILPRTSRSLTDVLWTL